MSYSRMCRRVVLGADVSEENIASIFKVKNQQTENTLAIASDCSTQRRLLQEPCGDTSQKTTFSSNLNIITSYTITEIESSTLGSRH
jgi:hypothetical protein